MCDPATAWGTVKFAVNPPLVLVVAVSGTPAPSQDSWTVLLAGNPVPVTESEDPTVTPVVVPSVMIGELIVSDTPAGLLPADPSAYSVCVPYDSPEGIVRELVCLPPDVGTVAVAILWAVGQDVVSSSRQ